MTSREEAPSKTSHIPAADEHAHLSLEELERRIEALPPPPTEVGRVALLVSRPGKGDRQLPDRVRLTVSGGMPADRWAENEMRRPENQLTMIQSDIAETIANGQDLALFGDNLFVALELSETNLPIGTRLQLGSVTLELTPEPHTGCGQYRDRFGADALRFISSKERRDQKLRGVHMRVVEDGDVCVGDEIRVLSRPGAATEGHGGKA